MPDPTSNLSIPNHYECYELCVQSPRHIVTFLRALYTSVHDVDPSILAEDFAGTCAVARRWVADLAQIHHARAYCADLDPETLAYARAKSLAELPEDLHTSIDFVIADCLATPISTPISSSASTTLKTLLPPADICFVGNFSIGYAKDRPTLIHYLTRVRDRLARSRQGFGGGIFVCDTYGGSGSFRLGGIERTHPGRKGELIRYAWKHEAADPLTGIVTNSISLRVERDGEVIARYPHAFEYTWRLWSIAELRDAFAQVGFTHSAVYTEVNLAPGEHPTPLTNPRDLHDDWVVLLAAFT